MIEKGSYICPDCGVDLFKYDKVKRKKKIEYRKTEIITIQRWYCKKCHRVHRENDPSLIPYKQYSKQIIEDAKSGQIGPEFLEYEDYPCEATFRRWKDEKDIK